MMIAIVSLGRVETAALWDSGKDDGYEVTTILAVWGFYFRFRAVF